MTDDETTGTAPAFDADVSFSLPDVPDMSGFHDDARPDPWQKGNYEATIVAERTYTKDGALTVFRTEDVESQGRAGPSRNINLQLAVTRKSDGRVLYTNARINYRPDELTKETLAAVIQHKEAMKAASKSGEPVPQWGPLFHAFATIRDFAALQRIAGLRQLQRTAGGGFDLTPLHGKRTYVYLDLDDRGKYMEVKSIDDAPPKRAPLL